MPSKALHDLASASLSDLISFHFCLTHFSLPTLTFLLFFEQLRLSITSCCLVAKLCLALLQLHGLQPAKLLCSWYFPGKNTGVGCHFLLQCRKVKSENVVVQSCPTFQTPWTVAYQVPLSMGVSRQEYWSGDERRSLNCGVTKPSPQSHL